MTRIMRILAQVVNKSGNPSGVSAGNMRIPGMKIGTQISPGGPSYEDIVWLTEKIDRCKDLLGRIGTQEAQEIIKEIDEGS